ncbi:UDP-3-O-acyl-N-acetylglucosamine deacetylase [Candidatus Margulisiibacteriota bacterium]
MFQKTLKKEVIFKGIALHSGKKVLLKMLPASAGVGISFVRVDIKGSPVIKASLFNISDIKRSTNLGFGKAKILTIEHVLSALSGVGITNVRIELDGPEPPILDGSAKGYVQAIKKAGIKKLGRKLRIINVKRPLILNSKGSQIAVLPSDRFKVSFMINYPGTFIGSQVFTFDSKTGSYESEIAPARTYGFMNEVKHLRKAGLIKGATLKNTIAITNKGYSTGLRFKDELVRHKILDLIGDLSLTGHYVRAHVIGIRSGHELNIKMAKKLMNLGGKKK